MPEPDPGVNLISKPFTFRELALSVRRLLDEERTRTATAKGRACENRLQSYRRPVLLC